MGRSTAIVGESGSVLRMIDERSEKKICSWQTTESRSSPESSKGEYITVHTKGG